MKDGSTVIDYGRIKVICDLPIHSLLGFEFSLWPNAHAQARLRVLLEEEREGAESGNPDPGETLRVVETSEDGTEKYPPLFAGVILDCAIHYEGGGREADIHAVSGSFLLDTGKKSRSFQEVGSHYEDLIDKVLSYTEKASCLYCAGDKAIDRPIIQYQETDFSFAVRVASHQNTCIYPDITEPLPRIFYGFPEGVDRGEVSVSSYQMGMESCFKRKTDIREALQFYEITSGVNYRIGDTVRFRKSSLRICAKKGRMANGVLYFSYILARDVWTWHEKKYNPLFPGVSLAATVLECRQEYVKLHLDIDSDQDIEKAYLFPWKPETGNLMYCMPEIGGKVYLKVTGGDEGEAHAVNCLRSNGTTCPETQDPDKRFFSNEHGKKLKIHPDILEFQGGGPADSLLKLRDNEGIRFRTGRIFRIKAAGGVQLNGKNVSITTPQELTVVKKDMISPTIMNLNHTIDIIGGKGKVSSSGGKGVTPLIGGRHEEEYDMVDISESVLSSIPQGKDEGELDIVLSASLVNILHSGK